MADKSNIPDAEATLASVRAWVEARRQEGWTREDFLRGLGEMLGAVESQEPDDKEKR
jgi:hypothetical protein